MKFKFASTRRSAAVVLAFLSLLSVLPFRAGVTVAAPVCSKWASETGNDLNDGSQSQPLLTLRRLASLLAPGETGCIRDGSTLSWKVDGFIGYGVITHGGALGAPITVRPEPGGRATFQGRVEISETATDVVLTGLTFRPEPTDLAKANLIQVNGDRVELSNNDISYPGGICVGAGHKLSTAYNSVDDIDYADDLILRGNRIHGCGSSPDLRWTPQDSGAHGVYLQFTRRALVTENLIYGNRWRGLQTWPQAIGTTITNNLFDGNATDVNIGSALPGSPWKSEGTVVRNNIMVNRVTNFEPTKNPASIYGNFPMGTTPAQYGNLAEGNCLDPQGSPATGGNGVSFGQQITASPVFVNRNAGDFRLVPGSSCLGIGPSSIQPAPTPIVFSGNGPKTVRPGSTYVYVWTVRNGGTNATAVDFAISISRNEANPSVRPVHLTTTKGSCPAMTGCAVGYLAAGEAATMTLVIDVLRATPFTLTGTATDLSTQGILSVRFGPTIEGPSCTMIGTNGPDTLLGIAGANDVLCGFGGDDVLRPGQGDDIVIGGAGNDTVSYVAAAAGVVVNLTQQAAWDNGTGGVGWDVLSGIENATGTAYADRLVGNAGINVLNADGGNDMVYGLNGNDILRGGTGADHLYGGSGNDSFDGGPGRDLCRQNTGIGPRAACELA